jgi:hypothetical protein
MRRPLAVLPACLLVVALTGCVSRQQDAQAAALACARASELTDQAITDCYTERGLPAPGVLD